MSIYTKSGDKGETELLGGKRISKSSLRIAAIGEVDELNAAIGVLRTSSEIKNQRSKIKTCTKSSRSMTDQNAKRILTRVQHNLFTIGTELADPNHHVTAPRIKETHVKKLEAWIDEREKKLPPLKNFILPGGTSFVASAHLARAVCRRAERAVVAIHKKEPINPQIIIYLNRLSDLLFMLTREDNFEKKGKEIIWKFR